MLPFYLFYNMTGSISMDDSCLGYLKHVICYNEFPACEDAGDGYFVYIYFIVIDC